VEEEEKKSERSRTRARRGIHRPRSRVKRQHNCARSINDNRQHGWPAGAKQQKKRTLNPSQPTAEENTEATTNPRSTSSVTQKRAAGVGRKTTKQSLRLRSHPNRFVRLVMTNLCASAASRRSVAKGEKKTARWARPERRTSVVLFLLSFISRRFLLFCRRIDRFPVARSRWRPFGGHKRTRPRIQRERPCHEFDAAR